jgi:hypothetical protein
LWHHGVYPHGLFAPSRMAVDPAGAGGGGPLIRHATPNHHCRHAAGDNQGQHQGGQNDFKPRVEFCRMHSGDHQLFRIVGWHINLSLVLKHYEQLAVIDLTEHGVKPVVAKNDSRATRFQMTAGIDAAPGHSRGPMGCSPHRRSYLVS